MLVFIARFREYTQWPHTAWAKRNALTICVPAPNPFGTVLGELVASTRIQDRPAKVQELTRTASVDGCHVLVIPRDRTQRVKLLNDAAQLPILTVGDYPETLSEGGIIRLRLEDGHVRFDVNLKQSNRVGLTLSSQLLRLAGDIARHEP